MDDLQDQLIKAPERMNAVRSMFSLSLRRIISGLMISGELLPGCSGSGYGFWGWVSLKHSDGTVETGDRLSRCDEMMTIEES